MERKGLGHIEVIVSFMLFIVGIGFSLYYFIPIIYEESGNGDSINPLVQFAETRAQIYSVIVDNSGNQIEQGNVGSSLGVLLNESGKFVVTDGTYVLNSKKLGKVIYFNSSWNNRERVYIIFSEDVNEIISNLNTPNVNNSFYDFGSVQTMNLVSEKKIIEMNASYYSDYDSLKQQMGLGKNKDFRFRFYFNGVTIETMRDIPSGREISSMSKEVAVLGKNGIIGYGLIEEEIW